MKPRSPNGMVDGLFGHLEPHLTVVNLDNLLPVVRIGVRNVEMELEPTGAEQGGVEALDEVGSANDKDHFLFVEAVHLGEKLVDHRMLDTGAGVGAAGSG